MAVNSNNITNTLNHSSPDSSTASHRVSIGGVSDSPLPPLIGEVPSSQSATENFVNGGDSNGNVNKKPTVWNKPSNVALAEVGPVMGAESWPALGESTRILSKLPPDSSKGLPDSSQGTESVSSPSFGQATSASANANANHSTTLIHTGPTRQKSTKHAGVGTPSNNGVTQLPTQFGQLFEVTQNNASPKDSTQKSGSASQSHNANENMQQRNSFRGRNSNPHTRGESSHHHGHGGRRDQDRRNHDWNVHRNFNGRDAHMPPQRVGPRFWRPSPPTPGSTPFIGPHPIHPFASPIAYSDMGPWYYVPTPLPPMFFPVDQYLHTKIVAQIDYYFSNENLVRDPFLRNNMDDQGWVPIQLIAGFNKVKMLTEDIRFILDALRTSLNVEVQGDKVRRRNDWMRYPRIQFANVPRSESPGTSSHDILAAGVQGIGLEENSGSSIGTRFQTDISAEGLSSLSLSGDLHNQSQSQLLSRVGTGEESKTSEGISDLSVSAKNSSKKDVL